jgi:hypothetical protein
MLGAGERRPGEELAAEVVHALDSETVGKVSAEGD